MSQSDSADLVVDTSGRYCPVPILEVAKAIKQVEPGQVVQVVATDPGVESDLPAWCRATRHQLLSLVREGQTFRARVRRGA